MEEGPITDVELDLWLLMFRVRHAMLRSRQKELSLYNITPGQAYLICIIHDLGINTTVKQISKDVFREVHSTYEQIKRIEKKGLIKKIKDKSGNAAARFELTDKGLEVYKFVTKRESMHRIMSVLSDDEHQQLKLYLEKLLNEAQLMLP